MFEFFKAKLAKKQNKKAEKQDTAMFSDCLKELEEKNDTLMKFGEQSDGCSSDSCPSEDNLDDNDMAMILPIKKKPKKPKKEKPVLKKQPSVKIEKPEPKKPKPPTKKEKPVKPKEDRKKTPPEPPKK